MRMPNLIDGHARCLLTCPGHWIRPEPAGGRVSDGSALKSIALSVSSRSEELMPISESRYVDCESRLLDFFVAGRV
jgi:hypothetical protein